MLYLFFSLGDQQFALRTAPVRRIVPGVRLRPLPASPDWIRGLLNYHESVVPVVDLSSLLIGQAASDALGSRIILIDRPGSGSGADGSEGLVGLLAEKVLEVHSISEEEIRSSGVRAPAASSLGRVVVRHGELIHVIELDDLLSGEQRRELSLEPPGVDP